MTIHPIFDLRNLLNLVRNPVDFKSFIMFCVLPTNVK